MAVGIKNAERVKLTGKKIKIEFFDSEGKRYHYDVLVERELGEGNSCICYEVIVYKNKTDLGQRRVLKQFYPDPKTYEIDTVMDGATLEIKGYSQDEEETQNIEITKLGKFFENAYNRQIKLANLDELTGVVVKPELGYFDGSTKYVLYEADYGKCFNVNKFQGLEDVIKQFYALSKSIEKLHKNGILYLDLKPENVLLDASGGIKLFDFDAAIEKSHISSIHLSDLRFDTNELLVAPELREDNIGEFEQNKSLFLNERLDIYAIGAMLFSALLKRYPTLEDCSFSEYEKELIEIYNVRYRGELTEDEQKKLNHIIWKCIQKDLGVKGRYNQTKNLVDDLEQLVDLINAPIEKRRRVYNKVNGRMQSAFVLDKYPLCEFRKEGKDNIWIMDALIVGDHPICEDFLKNIYASAQMLNTNVVIRIATSSAEKKLNEYILNWPLLKKTTEIYLEDKLVIDENTRMPFSLDTSITKEKFAELRFYEWDNNMKLVDFYCNIEKYTNITWFVVADNSIKENLGKAEELADQIEENNNKTLIAYLDERGDGFDLRKSSQKYEYVTLFPFGFNTKKEDEEKIFNKGINKKAYLLHKYYMREWYERASETIIENDYRSDKYNVNSSLASVLSIPYKLESVGIKTRGDDAANEFSELVLGEDKKAKKKFNQLLYLEHKRWMCFMVTEGYDKPGKKDIDLYAFRGNNDQRNKVDKLHPCICDCDLDEGIRLEQFPHDFWEKPNFYDIAQKKDYPLDELDKMSVWLHQWCSRRIKQLIDEGAFEDAFSKLERAMKREKQPSKNYEMIESLRIISKRMIDNESNINCLWEKGCNVFNEMIEKNFENSKIHIKDVKEAFKELRNIMRVVIERNSYHDYKSSDRTILEILPLLLMSDNPIRIIHKPIGTQTWHNIVSSLIIEPNELYLYTDEPERVELELMESFLVKERGIALKIIVQDMDELKQLKKSSDKSILDITGLSAEESYEVTNMKNLFCLPIVVFENGKLKGLNGKSEVNYYGVLRRHITVAETFQMHHANIYSDDSQNYMIGLTENYENIWSAYISMGSFPYRILVETLQTIEKNNYWKIDTDDLSNQPHSIVKKRIPYSLIYNAGIDKIISELFKDKLIEGGYSLPTNGQINTVSIKTKYGSVKDYIERMFNYVQQFPYMHNFRYIRTQREPVTDKPSSYMSYYIYDDTLVVDECISNDEVDHENHVRRKEILKQALSKLEQQKSKSNEPLIIEAFEDNGSTLIEDYSRDSTKFIIKFIYRNRSTKECLMKEGNILETYVYHSIWKNALVDDVKLNVAFTWDAENSSDALEKGAITNEIDLVCTKNMQSYFISCKQSMPKTAYLQEIKYFADYFGINGKAILITSNWATSGKQGKYDAELIKKRSQKMQVYYIDRSMIGTELADMNQQKLAKYIQNIIDGKKDWKVLSD